MPKTFAKAEYADMVFVYGFCNGSGRAAVEEYRRRYPNRAVPHHNTFSNVFQCWRETGSCPRPRIERQRDYHQQADIVLNAVERSPSTSIRRISRMTGVRQTQVWRILHHDGLYPYHTQRVQHLLPDDSAHRVRYCQWLQNNLEVIPRILFTDEAQFTRDGINNTRNSHTWAHQNPHNVIVGNHQRRFSVNIWCGLLNNHLIGPHFIEGYLTADYYRNFLEESLPEYMENVPLEARRGMFFQHDGAPPHFGRRVAEFLNENFPERWIGRGGPVPWPARSPDLSPLDFFLWGCLKSRVYNNGKPDTREELIARIVEAVDSLRNELAEINWQHSMARRVAACLENGGEHFEQLL